MAWFNFGSQDLGKEVEAVRTEQVLQRNLLTLALNQIGVLVALVSIDQSTLNELGVQLGVIADGVQSIIDSPDNDLGPADLTSVTDAVSRLQNLVASPETPAAEVPVDGGDTGTDAPPADAGQPTE